MAVWQLLHLLEFHMNRSDKHRHWQHHINTWRSSGLSQRAYCTEFALSLASFSYWHKKLGAASPGSRGKLIRLTAAAAPVAHVHVRLARGLELNIPVAALGEVLPTLLSALEARA